MQRAFRRAFWGGFAAIVAATAVMPSSAQVAVSCVDPTNCILTTPGCIPAPTSLPTAGAANARGDYEPVGRNCGIKRRFCIFWTACGPSLASPTCGF